MRHHATKRLAQLLHATYAPPSECLLNYSVEVTIIHSHLHIIFYHILKENEDIIYT